MRVPFVDLNRSLAGIMKEVRLAMEPVIEESSFVGGPALGKFEKKFADYCGTSFAVGTSSGTTALRLALAACGVGRGDEVITAPNTFIATAEAISQVGARPVFVDIDSSTGNMDTSLLIGKLTENTKALVPVHLYGHPMNVGELVELLSGKNVTVVEDACQAHGAEYFHGGKWVKTGTQGRVGCFSFYPTKNLGAFGEGGAITTNDAGVAESVRMLRDHGQRQKHVHELEGSNERLDSIQAAVLNVKLSYLDDWNAERRRLAEKYDGFLAGLPVLPCRPRGKVRHVFHLYVIRTERREALRDFLKGKGIDTALHYPTPVHLQPAYSHLGHKEGDFPEAERWAGEVLSLPMFVGLTDGEVEYVAGAVREFFGG